MSQCKTSSLNKVGVEKHIFGEKIVSPYFMQLVNTKRQDIRLYNANREGGNS